METMHAVVLAKDGKITFEQRPVPRPAPGEVLVNSQYCGICGTDLHAPSLMNHFKEGVIMGHEFAGEIVELGGGVSGWKVGERVAVNPNGDICGKCSSCLRGNYNLCAFAVRKAALGVQRDGGLAEYVRVPVRSIHRLHEGVSTLQGAWVEPLAVSVRAVTNSGFQFGDCGVVFGGGPIGLLMTQLLKNIGAATVTVVEPSKFRRLEAERLGADVTIDPGEGDVSELFMDRQLKMPDVIFECSGNPIGFQSAVALAAPKSTVTVVGIAPEPLKMVASEFVFKELAIRGSFIYVEEFPLAIRMLAEGVIDVQSLTTSECPLASFEEAFESLRSGDESVKIMLKP